MICQEKYQLDLLYDRQTWPVRYMLVVLAMYSGLRVVEIADLKVCDFYFSRNYPYLIVRNGKGGKKRMHWRRRE